MVTRNYTAPEFNVQNNQQYTQANVAQSDNRVLVEQSVGDDTWRDKLLQGLGGNLVEVLNKAADIEITNQYLEGQAAVGIVESEDELEGNPLTKDWKLAGYRDTVGKLALADSEAQFSVDLVNLRQEGPEALEAYISDRRNKLTPVLGSMSREARANSAGQLLLQDRVAIKRHTAEHAKFITEQKVQALTTGFSVSLNDLKAAQIGSALGELTPEVYQDSLRNTFGLLVGGTWQDNGLPYDVKQANTVNSIALALQADQPDLYNYALNNPIPDGQGGSSTIISRLTTEDQTKLANGYREAMQRTADQRNLFRQQQVAEIGASIEAGTYSDTYNNLLSMTGELVLNKAMSGAARQTLIGKYLTMQNKGEVGSLASAALDSGDVQSRIKMGLTAEQAIKSKQEWMVKQNLKPEQQFASWTNVGQQGEPLGYKKAGELLGYSVRQLASSKDGEGLSQHRDIFRAADATLNALEGSARTIAETNMLSGMSEEDSLFAKQVFGLVSKGHSYDGAVVQARADYELNAKLTPSQKAGLAANKLLQAVEPENMWERTGTWVKSLFSQDSASLKTINPSSAFSFQDGIFGDNPIVEGYADVARREVMLTYAKKLQTTPNADTDALVSESLADVARRTIRTDHGPLIAPTGANIGQIFGVGPANIPAIGPAISKILTNTKADSSWAMQFSEGRIWTQEYTRDGTPIGTGNYLDIAQVKEQMRLNDAETKTRANYVYGAGKSATYQEILAKSKGDKPKNSASGKIKPAKVSTGSVTHRDITVNYNGLSTSGAPATWVYDFRDNLVKHEGVRGTAYIDLSGKLHSSGPNKGKPIMTVGVGVSSHNSNFPKLDESGRITSEQASASFDKASNAAATAGARVAKDTGFYNSAGFQLFSELAYQSGTAFNTQGAKKGEAGHTTGTEYRVFIKAMQSGDVEFAKHTFKNTAAWKYSSSKDKAETPRQKSYIKLIEEAMRRN